MLKVNGFKHLRVSRTWSGWLNISLRVVLALILLLFVVYPDIRRVLEVRKQIEELSQEKSVLGHKLDRIKLFLGKYPEYSQLLEMSRQYLPGEPLVLGIVSNLIDDASASGLTLEDFRYNATAVPAHQRRNVGRSTVEGLESMLFSITGRGSYSEFKSFLVSMVEDPREIQLVDLSLREGESGQLLIVGITGRFFWKPTTSRF